MFVYIKMPSPTQKKQIREFFQFKNIRTARKNAPELLGQDYTGLSNEELWNDLYELYKIYAEDTIRERRQQQTLRARQARAARRVQRPTPVFYRENIKLVQRGQPLLNNKFMTTDITYNINEPSWIKQEQIQGNFDNALNEIKLAELIIAKIPDISKQNRVVLELTVQVQPPTEDDPGTEIRTVSTKLKANLTIEDIVSIIPTENYNEGIILEDTIITIQERRMPIGGSAKKLDPFLVGRKGFIEIINDDNLCGQRCLTLATMNPKYRSKILSGEKKIDNKLKEMCNYLEHQDKMEITDFNKFKLNQVVIIGKSLDVLYSTEVEGPKIYIYWDFVNQHYHLINNINSFSNKDGNYRWCEKCDKRHTIKNFDIHKCNEIKCACCYTSFITTDKREEHFQSKKWIKCGQCNMPCPSVECLKAHQTATKGIKNPKLFCDGSKWRCECKKWLDKDRLAEHKCGEKFCKNCETYYEGTHRCYIQKLEPPETPKIERSYYSYDMECEFDDENNHICNYAVVQKLYNDEFLETFYNIDDLVKWMVEQKHSTFYAHNGKAYDNWMVHQHIVRHTGERPSGIILAGNKIMKMKINTIEWLDSLNHIAAPLDGLPKMFGLDTTQFKKGFFPYKFNVKENQKYKGKIPDMKYFEPDRMKPEKRKEFIKWWLEQHFKKVNYDFKKELVEYCISDVSILRKALEIYRDDAMTFNEGLDPLRSPTIASYCMKVFRTNHLKDSETIAVLTKEEYTFCKSAFFGGRTNAVQLYKKWTPEDIKNGICGRYKDVQSLYPTVQFYDYMPVGAPEWKEYNSTIEEPLKFCDDHFGFIECDITPPNDLYLPVLPEHKDGKLIFDLLPKTKKVFTSLELKKAIEKGYKLDYVYKCLVFEKSNQVFKSYVSNLLKMKVEASGTKLKGEALDEFIREHEERFGFTLNKDNMKLNSGMRALMKIQLNSLWGKLGQRKDLTTTKYITEPKDWFNLLKKNIDGKIDLRMDRTIDIDDGSTLFVEYTEREDENTSLPTTSVAFAAFTTSNARLRLYAELDKLDKRVIYFDTDSIIYEHREGEYNIPDGKFLGEWECETDGKPITEFVSIGPKSYGYKYDGKVECKFKGFTLNWENSGKINFDSIKRLVDGDEEKIETTNMDFKKNNKTGVITTNDNFKKSAVFCYNKREVVNKYNTLPFGWGVEVPCF